jgi:hypothetical protein
LTIEEAVEVYAAMGFDFLAFTDHDYLLREGCHERLRSLETDLILFSGVELTVFEKGYVHVNRIEGEREVLHVFNHPAELDLPVSRVLERIRAVAGRLPIDAVEITSQGFRTPEFDVPEIPYPKVATDDAHTRQGCGRAWVEMDCARDPDAIIRAIRQGDFWNCYADSRASATRPPRD